MPGHQFGGAIRVGQTGKLRRGEQERLFRSRQRIKNSERQIAIVLVLFVLLIHGFEILRPARVPRQEPNAITVFERFQIKRTAQVVTILQIKHLGVMLLCFKCAEQFRANQTSAAQY